MFSLIDRASNNKIDYITGLGDSKPQRKSKMHHWLKSYSNFSGGLDFAYWSSCIGKGLRLQPAQQACYSNKGTGQLLHVCTLVNSLLISNNFAAVLPVCPFGY